MPARRALTLVIAVSCAFLLSSSAGAREERGGLGLIGFWSDDPWPSIWTVRPDGTHRTRILRTQQNAKRPGGSSSTARGRG